MMQNPTSRFDSGCGMLSMLARFQALSELQSWRFGVTGQLPLKRIETVQFPLTPCHNNLDHQNPP